MSMAISVVIPAYNCATTIAAAITSVREQSHDDFELIIVDDGSTDTTADMIAGIDDSRLRMVQHATNQGAAAARNTGIREARGAWVAFLDSDDLWHPDKLARQLAFVKYKQQRATTTGVVLKHLDGKTVTPVPGSAQQGLSEFVWGCYVSPGSTLMVERALFDEVGHLDTAFPRLEDWDWLLRFALAGHCLGVMAEPLATIQLSGVPLAAAVEAGLKRMETKYTETLNAMDKALGRAFRAGIAVEWAAQAFRDGMPLRAAGFVLASLALYPLGNQAFYRVVKSRLSRV